MQHGIDRSFDADVFGNVVYGKLKPRVFFEVLDVLAISSQKIIDAMDRVTDRKQLLAKVAAEKPRPTGDDHPPVRPVSMVILFPRGTQCSSLTLSQDFENTIERGRACQGSVSPGMGVIWNLTPPERWSFPSRKAGGIQSSRSAFRMVCSVDSRLRGND